MNNKYRCKVQFLNLVQFEKNIFFKRIEDMMKDKTRKVIAILEIFYNFKEYNIRRR